MTRLCVGVYCANWAPSALNRQPWDFIVVNGDWIKKLSASYKGIVEKFASNVEIKDIGNIASSKDFIQFASAYGGAPVIVLILTKMHSDPKEARADLESASAAMENFGREFRVWHLLDDWASS